MNLHTVLGEGKYEILLFLQADAEEIEMIAEVGGVDLTVHLNVNPVMERPDRFNCEAGRVPHDLTELVDAGGFLMYFDKVFVDVYAGTVVSRLEVFKASVLRVTSVEPAGISVQILLKKGENGVSMSENIGGSEGLLLELSAAVYYLEISFKNSILDSDNSKFCETISLQVGLSPISAVKSLISDYKLKECQDSSKALTELFNTFASELSEQFDLLPKSNIFTLPLQDLVKSEQNLFTSSFTLTKSTNIYFEIFSDFIISNLSFIISKGQNSQIKITEKGAKSFNKELSAGKYFFTILSAPTAMGSVPDKSSNVLEKCVAFQLRLKATLDICKDFEGRVLPTSLNTLGLLGLRDTPQSYLATTVLFGSDFLMESTIISSEFYLAGPSFIRVSVSSANEPLQIRILQGSTILSKSGSVSSKAPYSYSISLSLNQHISYSIVIEHYQVQCTFITLLLEIIPIERLPDVDQCTEKIPNQNLIQERTLGYSEVFEILGPSGFSSTTQEPVFTYLQNKAKKSKFSIALNITSKAAIVTSSLTAKFIQAGLGFQLQSDSEILQWGTYKAPHRNELSSIVLSQGEYEIIIIENAKALWKSCVEFRASLLIEDLGLWDDISNLVKKTGTCSYPDQPNSLQVVGQMERGEMHWNKKLPNDLLTLQTEFQVSIYTDSLVNVFVPRQNDVVYTIAVGDESKMSFYEYSRRVELAPNDYKIIVKYEFASRFPKPNTCPSFEVDLEILPTARFEEISKQYKCITTDTLPSVLPDSKANFLIFGPLDHIFSLGLAAPTLIKIYFSYLSILSGYVKIDFYDADNGLLGQSKNLENWGMLSVEVPEGSYNIRIYTLQSITFSCWPLEIRVATSSEKVCPGGILPFSLTSPDSIAYGGPQAKDGSISFNGQFKIAEENPKEILKISAPVASTVRILTLSSESLQVDSAIYTNNQYDRPLGFSNNKSKSSSFLIELPGQHEPYQLILSFIVKDSGSCLHYTLKIVVEPSDRVKNLLECKVNVHDNLLPLTFIDLSQNSLYGNDEFAIFDKWVIGENLPDGVISKGNKNTKFVFKISVKVPSAGRISIQVNYDFLTNDIQLELKQAENRIALGLWEIISDDELADTENFSSSISEFPVAAGTYEIYLKQGDFASKLIQKYSDISICFPFSFFIEYSTAPTLQLNYISNVNPPQVSHHNPLKSLQLTLTFHQPLQVPITTSTFFLSSDSQEIFPIYVSRDPENLKVKLKFPKSALKIGQCYELKLNTKEFVSDGLSHVYCCSNCKCNPNASAECTKNSQCVCPEPYAGNNCYACVEGFELKKDVCEEIPDLNPSIVLLDLDAPIVITKEDIVKLYVEFSSAPFGNDGVKVSLLHPEAIIKTFVLVTGIDEIPPANIFPLNKGGLKWVLEYNPKQFEYGKTYNLKVYLKNLQTSAGMNFANSFNEILQINIAETDPDLGLCGSHGKIKGIICECDMLYTGHNCQNCIEGYMLNDSDNCEVLPQDDLVDLQAKLKSVIPNVYSIAPQGTQITIQVELNQKAYNANGHIIDSLSNAQNVQSAFVLKQVKKEKYIKPIQVKNSDNHGINWKIFFATEDLKENSVYSLVQVKGFLYTEEGKLFSPPDIELPRFQIGIVLDCHHGWQEQDYCVCEEKYKGFLCEECEVGFFYSLQEGCIEKKLEKNYFSQKKESEGLGLFEYFAIYLAVAVGFVIGFQYLMKNRESNSEFEMVPGEDLEDEGIDLHMT